MSKRKKKKKNKKNIFTAPSAVTDQNNQANSEVQVTPKEDSKIAATAQLMKKDLLRIFLTFLILIIILAGGVIIRSQTSWLEKGADWLYLWLKLG